MKFTKLSIPLTILLFHTLTVTFVFQQIRYSTAKQVSVGLRIVASEEPTPIWVLLLASLFALMIILAILVYLKVYRRKERKKPDDKQQTPLSTLKRNAKMQ